MSISEEGVAALGLRDVGLYEDSRQGQAQDEGEEQSVVEVLLDQVEVVLRRETRIEDVKAVHKHLGRGLKPSGEGLHLCETYQRKTVREVLGRDERDHGVVDREVLALEVSTRHKLGRQVFFEVLDCGNPGEGVSVRPPGREEVRVKLVDQVVLVDNDEALTRDVVLGLSQGHAFHTEGQHVALLDDYRRVSAEGREVALLLTLSSLGVVFHEELLGVVLLSLAVELSDSDLLLRQGLALPLEGHNHDVL